VACGGIDRLAPPREWQRGAATTTRGQSAHLSERAISDRRPNPKWGCGKNFVRTALALDLGPICSIGGFS
jgi:hypothetical protein